MGVLAVQLLGDFRLTADGASPSRAPSPRAQSLIGWLVLHGGTRPTRLQLAAAFWPDAAEDQARGNLRKALHDLRRAVPEIDRLVHVEGDRVWWDVESVQTVDVYRFEAAAREASTPAEIAQAVDLYRGELLPECYDDWVLEERVRLEANFVGLLQRGMERALQAGEDERAIAYGERLLAAEPLEEETYQGLMRAHLLNGDAAGALRIYHRCRTVLEQELGVEPGPETEEVYELVVRGAEAPLRQVGTTRLIGRQEEWEQLQATWQAALRGTSQAVLIRGEPGIGKTRLLEEVRTWAIRLGIRVGYARCYEAGAGLAYAPIAELVRSMPPAELDRVWLTELARILPDLTTRYPELVRPGPLTEAWQRTRLFEAISRAVLAQQPLIILLDDLQWVDQDSLLWLHHLLRSKVRSRILVVGAARPAGTSPQLMWSELWDTLRSERRLVQLDLEPLDLENTHELVHGVKPEAGAEEIQRLWAETEGNPFFLLETLRTEATGEAVPPESIQAVLASRLSRLRPDSQELAQLASVIGREFRLPVLEAAWLGSDESLVQGLDELWRARIVRERGRDAYDFTHDKLRQAAYDALGRARRRLLHRRIGEALEAVADPRSEAAGEIARHLETAGLSDRAAGYYVVAADAARLVWANREAIALYRHALRLSRSARMPATLLSLGDVLRTAGSYAEAGEVYGEGIELARTANDRLSEARLHYGLGNVRQAAGTLDGSEEEFWRAATTFEATGHAAEQSRALAKVATSITLRGEFGEAEQLLADTLPLAEQSGDIGAQLLAYRALAHLYFYEQQPDRLEEYARRELDVARGAGELQHEGVALVDIGLAQAERGELVNAVGSLANGLDVLHGIGFVAGTASTIVSLADVYRRLGRYVEVLRCSAVAAHLAAGNLYPYIAHAARALLGHVQARAGRWNEAEHLLLPAVAFLEGTRHRFVLCETLYYLADLRERQGRLVEAGQLALRAADIAGALPRRDVLFLAEVMRVKLAAGRGDSGPTETERCLEAMLVTWAGPEHRAALHYELWRLHPQQSAHRLAAAQFYAELCATRLDALYRERYADLTGTSLPEPEIPKLPEIVRDYPGMTEELVAEVVRAIGDQCAITQDSVQWP